MFNMISQRMSHTIQAANTPIPDQPDVEGISLLPGERLDEGESKKDLREGKKLPLHAWQRVMDMIHQIDGDLRQCMASVIFDDKPLVWEMF